MIDGGKHDPVTDQYPVTDGDAALILKAATGINEDILSYGYIFSKVTVERREQGKRGINGLSRQSGHTFSDLFRGMV